MPYATQTDVEYVLSQLGVTLRTDDDADGVAETGNITYALEEATAQAEYYLLQRYDTTDLATSDYVTKATAALAACLLSRRRGNSVPPSLDKSCEKYIEQMEAIMAADTDLPGVSLRDDPGITTTGLVVDLRHPHMPIRRSAIRSTGDPPPSTVVDFELHDYEHDY